jgi:hypothetical protein
MVVTKNYQSTLHIDMDLFNSIISWFLESKYSLPHLSILNTSNYVGKKMAKLYVNITIMNLIRIGQKK